MRSLIAALSLACVVLMATPSKAAEPIDPFRHGPGPHFLSAQPFAKKAVPHKKRVAVKVKRQAIAAKPAEIPQTHERVARYVANVVGGRPEGCPSRAWCGCYLSKHLGLNERRLWVAREWARVGSPASGPAPGVVVVWAHHVGIIRQVTAPGRAVVHSGNDGRAVRERERSLRGVIAYRHVGARYAALLQ